jgi:hypothetical protein
MPAPTGINHNIAAVMRGVKAEFWISPTINADGTITLQPDGSLLNSGVTPPHPNARNVGYSQDGFMLSRTPTFEDLPVDQESEPIGDAYLTQDVHLTTKILQVRDYDNLAALAPGLSAQAGTGWKGISDSAVQSYILIPVAVVSPLPNDATKFQVIIVYAAKNVGKLDLTLAKKWNVTALDMVARPAGRTDGKTFMVYETTA